MKLEHKYEIYVPDKYVDVCGDLIDLDVEQCIKTIVKLLAEDGISGVSVRTETGYYAHSNGNVNKTTNYILYFYKDYAYICIGKIIDFIKNKMHQESVLVVHKTSESEVASLY